MKVLIDQASIAKIHSLFLKATRLDYALTDFHAEVLVKRIDGNRVYGIIGESEYENILIDLSEVGIIEVDKKFTFRISGFQKGTESNSWVGDLCNAVKDIFIKPKIQLVCRGQLPSKLPTSYLTFDQWKTRRQVYLSVLILIFFFSFKALIGHYQEKAMIKEAERVKLKEDIARLEEEKAKASEEENKKRQEELIQRSNLVANFIKNHNKVNLPIKNIHAEWNIKTYDISYQLVVGKAYDQMPLNTIRESLDYLCKNWAKQFPFSHNEKFIISKEYHYMEKIKGMGNQSFQVKRTNYDDLESCSTKDNIK